MTDDITTSGKPLAVLACQVLATADPMAKAAVAREVATAWREGDASLPGHTTEVPDRPGRPVKPELLPPGQMPKRRLGSEAGRIALLHAIAHIELNAIDLAFDMIARFSGELQPAHVREFIDDWISVGDDEARHFMMIQCRLEEYGSSYGALPAHDGLWDAAMGTQDDVMARLVIAPLVLEARGLDVTPGMIQNLRSHGDDASADILQVIYEEEIGHVATGARWLKHFCKLYDFDPKERFQHFVTTRFGGKLRKPFNHDARQKAGLEENFYLSLSL